MKRLLVVDDEKNLLLLYKIEFEAEGYQVDTAANAKDALEMFGKQHYDLVILDVKMPGTDGVEALEKLLARKNNLPVILNSAYDNYKDKFICWAADSYVLKNLDLTELKQKVRDSLGESDFIY